MTMYKSILEFFYIQFFLIEFRTNLHKLMIILAIAASVGIIGNYLVESVDAWHVEFSSKKECREAFMEVSGKDTEEANRICERLIPHYSD